MDVNLSPLSEVTMSVRLPSASSIPQLPSIHGDITWYDKVAPVVLMVMIMVMIKMMIMVMIMVMIMMMTMVMIMIMAMVMIMMMKMMK